MVIIKLIRDRWEECSVQKRGSPQRVKRYKKYTDTTIHILHQPKNINKIQLPNIRSMANSHTITRTNDNNTYRHHNHYTNNIKTTFNCTNYLLFENKNRPPAKVKSKNARQLPRVQDFLGCSTIHWWRGGDNSGSVSGVLLCEDRTEVSYMHCIFFCPNHSIIFQ